MRRFVLATLSAALVAAAGCSSNNSSTSSTGSPTSPASLPANTTTASIVLNASILSTTAYSPNPVVVKAGNSVTWTNNDNTAHTSTSSTGLWNSGTINPGGSFTFTFAQPGTYQYHCSIHPNMVGTVTVQ